MKILQSSLVLFLFCFYHLTNAQNYNFDYNNNGRRVCLVESTVDINSPSITLHFLDANQNTSEPSFVYRRLAEDKPSSKSSYQYIPYSSSTNSNNKSNNQSSNPVKLFFNSCEYSRNRKTKIPSRSRIRLQVQSTIHKARDYRSNYRNHGEKRTSISSYLMRCESQDCIK